MKKNGGLIAIICGVVMVALTIIAVVTSKGFGTASNFPTTGTATIPWRLIDETVGSLAVIGLLVFVGRLIIKRRKRIKQLLQEDGKQFVNVLPANVIFVRRFTALVSAVCFVLTLVLYKSNQIALRELDVSKGLSPFLGLMHVIGSFWLPVMFIAFFLLIRSFTKPSNSKYKKISLSKVLGATAFGVFAVSWIAYQLSTYIPSEVMSYGR